MSDTKLLRLLRIAEAAEQLAMKPATLRRWILCRKIRYVKVGERAVRIPLEEVERIILQGTMPTRST